MREPTQKLDLKAINGWRIEAIIEGLIVITLFVIVQAILTIFDIPEIIHLLIWICLGLYFLFFLYHVSVMPKQKYKKWKYEVSSNEIMMSEGIFFYRLMQVPINRIQHVTIKQGPIARRFQLASVEITTAASSVEINYLAYDLAERVSSEIKQFVLRSDAHE
ncbi:PH domain-containing protein [Candidatus Pristimantibacillus sp. PTI5]|uniref:PH domain-containing protein n=1 Tax=Candidatus Pristimantibacillus sp. PTI5 TaxID=3400422 RepID=UPI003B01D078